MANSGKQSPLGINLIGSLLNSTSLTINPTAAQHMGSSKTNDSYTFGATVNDTVLRLLTWAINDGYVRGPGDSNTTLTDTTYNNLISIGSSTIPGLGNSKPSTYVVSDPSGNWTTKAVAYGVQNGTAGALPGPATAGYSTETYSDEDQGQCATWIPYDTTNVNKSITQWGYTRLHALQAWNEFNWNGDSVSSGPNYSEFCNSFISGQGWLAQNNQVIMSAHNANTFMDGVYSNMNDLTSGDIAGVSAATYQFGQDLVNLGYAIDLSRLAEFGLPSGLLSTICKYNAVTPALSVAMLAAGLSTTELNELISGSTKATVAQEQKLYGAFLVVIGQNLLNITAALRCKTSGITSLADLLNVKKLFPLSYSTLTVPVYNSQLGLPTNSKTYYLIYDNGEVNAALNSAPIKEYVGTLIPSGQPLTSSESVNPENYVTLPTGFDSYLVGIIPQSQAIAAGALQFSMRQIRNIETVDILKFAKTVIGIETMTGLTDIAGSSKPTNQEALDRVLTNSALGSGPSGTYTLSDLFGCMTGLPYPWKLINKRINELTTSELSRIYRELFLAVTWEAATVTVQYSSAAGPLYTVTGVTITNPGGGYGRGSAPAPTITISDGSTAVVTIGTDDSDAASDGNGTFGRVVSVAVTPAAASGSIPTITIEAPPTSTSGGTNTVSGTTGWQSPMNAVVQNYIDLANTEISNIQTTIPDPARHLKAYWEILGTQLAREQRTRYSAFTPVTVPKDLFASSYPDTLYSFVDSIENMAQDTAPHMAAQTLEAIADFSNVGGQSLVGMMRQSRNQARLDAAGISIENNIPDEVSSTVTKQLTTNGTVYGAVDGINGCTFPAWPENNDSVPIPIGTYGVGEGFRQGSSVADGDITPILDGALNPVVGPLVSTGTVIENENTIPIIAPPPEYDPNNLPPNLTPQYTSSVLLASSRSIADAIEDVIRCNCDCWNT